MIDIVMMLKQKKDGLFNCYYRNKIDFCFDCISLAFTQSHCGCSNAACLFGQRLYSRNLSFMIRLSQTLSSQTSQLANILSVSYLAQPAFVGQLDFSLIRRLSACQKNFRQLKIQRRRLKVATDYIDVNMVVFLTLLLSYFVIIIFSGVIAVTFYAINVIALSFDIFISIFVLLSFVLSCYSYNCNSYCKRLCLLQIFHLLFVVSLRFTVKYTISKDIHACYIGLRTYIISRFLE